MPRYAVAGNTLLDMAVTRLPAPTFTSQQDVAEELLELDSDPLYEAELADKIARAIALQMNYQLATGSSAFARAADGPSEVKISYRNVRGEQPVLDPRAVALRDQVRVQYLAAQEATTTTSGWSSVRSVR